MRNPNFLFIVFAVIGIPCLLLAGYFTYTTIQQANSWQEEQGVITGFGNNNYPHVAFKHGNDTIRFRANYYSSDMRRGEAVTVYFPPNDPAQAEIKSFFTLWFLPLFLSVFGIVFGGIGVGGILRQKNKFDAKKELFDQQKGKKITVPISTVGRDNSYTVNGVSPFVIRAQWLEPSTNMMYLFTSDYIWYDPSQFLANKKQVDVYVDEQNLKRYYMDTTFLPQSAN